MEWFCNNYFQFCIGAKFRKIHLSKYLKGRAAEMVDWFNYINCKDHFRRKKVVFLLGVMVGEILQNMAILSSFWAFIVLNIFLVQTRIDNFILLN